MEIPKYKWIEAYSLTPHRLSIYRTKTTLCDVNGIVSPVAIKKDYSNTLDNITGGNYTSKTRFHNFRISAAAKKSMMLKINWLYFLAKSRYKKTLSGKEIFNFKLNFITLTLSSVQVHSTSEITSKIFNQFMTEIRQKYDLKNFVWRLEFQKNGNVHYHIVTDTYTDFFIVQKIWNRCQSKLGYVQAYAKKHQAMSLNDYVKEYSNNGAVGFDVLKRRYFLGRAHNWTTPNSVDVKNVSNGKKISIYISKYFAKKENNNNACNALDNEDNATGLRLWFCSRSLSKVKKVVDFVESTGYNLVNFLTEVKDTFIAVHDYCTSYFYSFASLLPHAKEHIHKQLYRYALSVGYTPSG